MSCVHCVISAISIFWNQITTYPYYKYQPTGANLTDIHVVFIPLIAHAFDFYTVSPRLKTGGRKVYPVSTHVVRADQSPNVPKRSPWHHERATWQLCTSGVHFVYIWEPTRTHSKIVASQNLPVAMETCFGFVVMGSTPIVLGSSNSLHSYYAVLEPKLDELVSKSCEIEPVPLKVSITPEYTECEKIYSSAAKRKLSSTYIVALPFKKGLAWLGDSYQWSLKSLHFFKKNGIRYIYSTPYLSLFAWYWSRWQITKCEYWTGFKTSLSHI